MQFEYFIGGRYLKTKQKQAFISLITLLSITGVTVGVMALIVVIAVMAGFESDLKSRILGVESHIVLTRHGGQFSDYRKVIAGLEKDDEIIAATPFIYSQVMLRSASGVSGALLRGISPDSAGRVIQNFADTPLQERFAIKEKETVGLAIMPGIILGKELARNLGVMKGDTVYIISPRGMLSPIGHVPRMKRFKVTDFFQSGMYEYDGSLAYISLGDAQELQKMGDTVSGIEIRIHDIYKAKLIGKQIEDNLGFPYWVRDWMQMNRNLFSALKLEKTVMFIILTLIILVAAFNIASSLIMMVMKKTRDIGILKAMGTTNRSIRKIFVFNGMIIGGIGTTLGVFLGSIVCFLLKQYKFIELDPDVYYISTLPVKLEMLDVLIIGCAALFICFLSTLYPAHQASKVDPVEAIRYG
jgi:lipoprotein-releasing system permease protein